MCTYDLRVALDYEQFTQRGIVQQKYFFALGFILGDPKLRLGNTRLSPSGLNKRLWPREVLHDVTPQQLPSSNMGVPPPPGNT